MDHKSWIISHGTPLLHSIKTAGVGTCRLSPCHHESHALTWKHMFIKKSMDVMCKCLKIIQVFCQEFTENLQSRGRCSMNYDPYEYSLL